MTAFVRKTSYILRNKHNFLRKMHVPNGPPYFCHCYNLPVTEHLPRASCLLYQDTEIKYTKNTYIKKEHKNQMRRSNYLLSQNYGKGFVL